MIFYRVKQFYWGIKSLFIKDDFAILNKYLNKSELSLFMKIDKAERYHSIRVCKSVIKYVNNNGVVDIDEYKICKCALLHDIGKAQAKLNIFDKSIIVIISFITRGKFLKRNKSKKIVNYYDHPRIGAEILESIKGMSVDIIDCVRYHHNKDMIKKNKYLEILTLCDNCN